MKNIILICGSFLIVIFASCSFSNKKNTEDSFTLISNPIEIKEGNHIDFKGNENLIFVAENRSKADSRKIGVHFFHFPAKEKTNLPPVFYLPSGPGLAINKCMFLEECAGWRALSFSSELMAYNQKRDVIVLNQRGNPDTYGAPIPNFKVRFKRYGNEEDLQKALKKRIKYYEHNGVDLAGYDILNIVDDIEDIRKQYNYKKVALLGSSFGTQWAMGYIQKYPDRVDRAFFAGVEPLDFEYDDPQGIWNTIKRIEKYALEDETLASKLPKIGLTEAIKTIVNRLEKSPQRVHLKVPKYDLDDYITVTADDFRAFRFWREIEYYPKYITELYDEDYRFLALWKWETENVLAEKTETDLMILPLINNSLGISKERESLLNSRPAVQWLGELNDFQKNTRTITPTHLVSDDFRKQNTHDIPILMLQGDLDMSTPLENAIFLNDLMPNSLLIKVKRGGHSRKLKLVQDDPELAAALYNFMNVDFGKTSFEEFKKTLPEVYEKVPALEFLAIGGKSLFEMEL